MADNNGTVNGTLAPLRNVSLFTGLVETVMKRPRHLPGIGVFCGPAGLGKSCSAVYGANRYKAFYVECKSTWTKKGLCQAILTEMGVEPRPRVYDNVDQIAERLMDLQRPLIIDEADHLLKRADSVEVVRDIYASCEAAIVLIGEEMLPTKLKKWERLHSRVLDWVRAEYCDMADAQHLRKLYCADVTVCDDLMAVLVERSRGSARRICVNLERVRQTAKQKGWRKVDVSTWAGREWFTGEAPVRARAA